MNYAPLTTGMAVLMLALCGALPAPADDFRDYASVLKVEPIFEGGHKAVPRRVCEGETGAGLAIAASIGEDVRQHAGRWASGPDCGLLPRRQYQQPVVGYRVTYNYGGVTAVRRMQRDPGKRLAVNVRLSPRP